jgi:hypothetical protein
MTDKERFDELTEKFRAKGGYHTLEKEEKEEYKLLKDKLEQEEEQVVVEEKAEEPKVEEKKIEVTQSQLEQIVADAVERARKRENVTEDKLYGKWKEFKEAEGDNQTATLKVWQPTKNDKRGLIVRQEYLKEDFNLRTGKNDILVYEIEVLYDDGKTDVVEAKVDDLVKINQKERVRIVKVDRKKMVKHEGTVLVTPKNKEGYVVRRADSSYGRAEGGFEVPLEVIKYDETFTCKRESGQTFEIKGIYLNN